MSYGQRIASFEQFVNILNKSRDGKFRYAPRPDQVSGLMEGAEVSLRLQEMSVDYEEHIAQKKGETYVPRHRVHATVLFDYSTYIVDVPDAEWFALPSIDQWQASLPVIHLPSEVIEKILDETPEEPNESLRAAADLRKELITENELVLVLTDGDPEGPEYLDSEEDPEDGGEAGVREPRPDDAPQDDAGAAVPLEAPVG